MNCWSWNDERYDLDQLGQQDSALGCLVLLDDGEQAIWLRSSVVRGSGATHWMQLSEPPPRERSAVSTDQDTSEHETASERHSGAVALKTSEDAIRSECNSLAEFLIAKNRSYGDSALDPVRVFSRADQVEQLLVRIDDKLSRIKRGSAAGEDVELDLLGYLVLLRIARNRIGADGTTPVDPGSLRDWLTSYVEECRESRDAAADDGDYESALRHRTRVEVLEDVLGRIREVRGG